MGAIEINNSPLKTSSASNLKAYYRMESGALTTDSSGNSVTLTNNNTVGEGTGTFGGAADFGTANTNKYLSSTNALGIDGGAISISFWVKLNTEISANRYYFVVQRALTAGETKTSYWIWYNYNAGTRQLNWGRDKNGTAEQLVTVNATLGTSNWYHMALTYDGTTLRGYLNGQSQGSVAASGSGGVTGTSGLFIGSLDGSSFFTNALIDDVSYFNRALTADEIKELYEGRSVGELWPNYSANLQGLWHLSGITDSSKNAYHLTNNGTTTFTGGKFGNASNFNGSSQYLNITNAAAANLYTTGDQTIFAWVYPTNFSAIRTIVSNSNASVNTGWSFQTETSGVLSLRSFKTGDDQSVSSSTTLTAGVWNFVAVSYTSSGQNVSVFVNGVKNTGTFSRALVATTGDTAIGRLGSFSGQYWLGNIDEVAFFNSALTDAQIKNYYAWAKGQRGGIV